MEPPIPLTAKRHAHLARELIKACDGLLASESVCRVGRTSLSNYCDPDHPNHMPADVMAALEAYCRQPLYSREIAAALSDQDRDLQDFLTEILEGSEAMLGLQAFVRLELHGRRLNQLDERRRRELAHRLITLGKELRDVLVAGDRVLT